MKSLCDDAILGVKSTAADDIIQNDITENKLEAHGGGSKRMGRRGNKMWKMKGGILSETTRAHFRDVFRH